MSLWRLTVISHCLIQWSFFCFLSFGFFCFLGPLPWHMEVPRLRVKWELQPQAYITATEMPIRTVSETYTTSHGSAGSLTHWGRPGIEPHNLMVTSQIYFRCATGEIPVVIFFTFPHLTSQTFYDYWHNLPLLLPLGIVFILFPEHQTDSLTFPLSMSFFLFLVVSSLLPKLLLLKFSGVLALVLFLISTFFGDSAHSNGFNTISMLKNLTILSLAQACPEL